MSSPISVLMRTASLIAIGLSVLKYGPRDGLIARFSWSKSTWQVLVALWMSSVALRGFRRFLLSFAPDRYKGRYEKEFGKLASLFVSLDAASFTANHLKLGPLRPLAACLLWPFFGFCHADAELIWHRWHAVGSVDYLRSVMSRGLHPIIYLVDSASRRQVGIRRRITIARPAKSSYREGIQIELFFDGGEEALKRSNEIIIDVPGGGWITFGMPDHEDRLLGLARSVKRPVVSIEYRKAPEWPFPYALNEVIDCYKTILETKGAAIGLRTSSKIKVVMMGDSSGGNIVTACNLAVLDQSLPTPAGLVLAYPGMRLNHAWWMGEEDIKCLVQEIKLDTGDQLAGVMEAKTHLSRQYLNGWHNSSDSLGDQVEMEQVLMLKEGDHRLVMTSWHQFGDDVVLTLPAARTFVAAYAAKAQVDLKKDYYFQPMVAPETLLARLPPIYLTCGDRDPLCDDTILFAAKVRLAKRAAGNESALSYDIERGWSHGYLQMPQLRDRPIAKMAKVIEGFFDSA